MVESAAALPRLQAPVAGARLARCRRAATPEDQAVHFAIRRQVFVEEQGFFDGTDRDQRDDDDATIHVIALCGGVAGGAVRLYPLDEHGLWKGDRLAVLPAFRYGLGKPLVRFAVRSAAERGGRIMVATVQERNVGFFEHLGWRRTGGPADYLGHAHQGMAIDLAP